MSTTAEPRIDRPLAPMRPAGRDTDELRVVGRPPTSELVPATRFDETGDAVRTVITDRSALFRAGLVRILAGTQFRVVSECPTLSLVADGALHEGETLLLLGTQNEDEHALEQVTRLKQKNPALRVVVLGDGGGSREVLAAMQSGADAYLAKNEIGSEVLLKSLELTLLGVVLLPQGLALGPTNPEPRHEGATGPRTDRRPSAREDAAQFSGKGPPAIPGLSGREQLILTHLMRGAANKLIARDLGIAEATVKVHVKSLLRKIRVKNRTQAAMWGMNHLVPERVAQSKAEPSSSC